MATMKKSVTYSVKDGVEVLKRILEQVPNDASSQFAQSYVGQGYGERKVITSITWSWTEEVEA